MHAVKQNGESYLVEMLCETYTEKRIKLYAVRDTTTGKLVNDITNPRRKFWEKKGMAQASINRNPRRPLELVEFDLVEVDQNTRDS